METRASKRKRLVAEAENELKERTRDRISDLPDAIAHQILSYLPVELIAQTCLLSKRWNYLWRSYPSLDFSTFRPRIYKQPTTSPQKPAATHRLQCQQATAMEFITTVLSRRHENSNVKIFRLSGTRVSFSCLSDSIRRLVRHRVEELELEVYLAHDFDLPRCLFACETLRVLKLNPQNPNPKPGNPYYSSCFQFPTSHAMASVCLRSLQTLSLTSVHFTSSSPMVVLFSASSFPLLKKLYLKQCEGIIDLHINCPSLEDLELIALELIGLDISGAKLESLQVTWCFRDYGNGYRNGSWVKIFAPSLETFHWEYNAMTEKCSIERFESLSQGSICFLSESMNAAKLRSVATLLSVLSFAGSMVVGSYVVELFSDIDGAGDRLSSFNNLTLLELDTGLNKHDMPGIVYLLRSSPILHSLTINIRNCLKRGNDRWNRDLLDGSNFTEEQYLESQTQPFKSFKNHLEVVKIDVEGTEIQESAVNVVKFLLRHGRVLQEMILSSESNPRDPPLWQQKIGSQIMEFPQASSNVKISLV